MPTPLRSDAILVVRCQLGDQQAWEELVERWQPRLWSFILRMVSDERRAEDVLQTVWLKVVRSLVRLREPQRLPAWLYGIARATIADRFREQYRRPSAQLDEDIAAVDRCAEQIDLSEFLGIRLETLHPTDREAVVLHYLEELPLAEVAVICGVPVGTIKSRLHHARNVLRKTLQT